jgi:hypothetical protein
MVDRCVRCKTQRISCASRKERRPRRAGRGPPVVRFIRCNSGVDLGAFAAEAGLLGRLLGAAGDFVGRFLDLRAAQRLTPCLGDGPQLLVGSASFSGGGRDSASSRGPSMAPLWSPSRAGHANGTGRLASDGLRPAKPRESETPEGAVRSGDRPHWQASESGSGSVAPSGRPKSSGAPTDRTRGVVHEPGDRPRLIHGPTRIEIHSRRIDSAPDR